MAPPLFHLAFPVTDLEATQKFYVETLGCQVGRSAERWIDFDFHGHQISAHLVDRMPEVATNIVDGSNVPAQHFGLILDWEAWHELRDRIREAGVEFLIEPTIRFLGQPGEQATMFVTDPSGTGLEFKAFQDPDRVFATAEEK